MTFNKFEELFKNLDDERQFDYWNAVCETNTYEEFVYPMQDIDEFLGHKLPSELLGMLDDDFNYNHGYFFFDGYGRLNSVYNAAMFFENGRGDISEIYNLMNNRDLQEFAEENDPDYNEDDWEDEK